ncbi:hypothetical protein FB479_108124 [Brevibacillus sp. AG162]|nr:hypothetical protein FB479_108124 [Brevibacillus sp. AG162]
MKISIFPIMFILIHNGSLFKRENLTNESGGDRKVTSGNHSIEKQKQRT